MKPEIIKSNLSLVWNVYIDDINKNKIKIHNIFSHYRFVDYCVKDLEKCKDDKDLFREKVKSNLMYCYWSKCEWEIAISPLIPCKNNYESKIDVYDQVMLNFDIFFEYIWENRNLLRIINKNF